MPGPRLQNHKPSDTKGTHAAAKDTAGLPPLQKYILRSRPIRIQPNEAVNALP